MIYFFGGYRLLQMVIFGGRLASRDTTNTMFQYDICTALLLSLPNLVVSSLVSH